MPQPGEFLTHCNSVRLRVTGTGNIRMAVFDIGEVKFRYLVDKAMDEGISGKTVTALTNITSELLQVEVRTTVKDETFTLSSIIPYVSPSGTGYPQ